MPLDQVDVDEQEKLQGKEMSFLDHLEELRWHVIRSLIVVVTLAIAIFLFKDFVFDTIIYGPRNEGFLSYRMMCALSQFIGLGETLCLKPVAFELTTVDFGEAFLLHIKVSIVLGVVVAFPIFSGNFGGLYGRHFTIKSAKPRAGWYSPAPCCSLSAFCLATSLSRPLP
jgi:sec-independent protein translocase protein TatC